MLELNVEPGLSLGRFKLGMRITEAIQITNQLSADKSDTFNRVDVIYNKNEPLSHPITIKYDQGFKLQFNPISQHLELIEVFNTAPLILSYRGKKFCSPEIAPSYNALCSAFGPTVAGDFETTNGKLVYRLSYPGMSLIFPIPDELADMCSDNVEVLPPECRHILLSNLILQENLERSRVKHETTPFIKAVVGEGIDVEGAQIPFGASPQEVLSEMGSPEAVFTKTDDFILHSPNSEEDTGDYFYNYFHLGLDILFDGLSHKAKKFVFHTNFPSHYLFNCYVKCNFTVQFPESSECLIDAPRKLFKEPAAPKKVSQKQQQSAQFNFDDDEEPRNEQKQEKKEEDPLSETDMNKEFMISGDTSWAAVQSYLGVKGRPFIFESPTGPTKIFGYPGLAVEVLEDSYLGCVYMFPLS